MTTPSPRSSASFAGRAGAAGLVVDGELALPTMWSWNEFLRRATTPPTSRSAQSRKADAEGWAGAGWSEAVRLATDGWTTHVPEVDLAIADLQSRAGTRLATSLVQVADTAGSEVDVAAYLNGVPECMLETEMRQLSTQGRVVTFLVPAAYSASVDHTSIVNRGKALCALCAQIVRAGHSVEVWSGFAVHCSALGARCAGAARVVAAGEPFDPSRLMYAMAHPSMLRRLWFGVWDGTDAVVAEAMPASAYGYPQASMRADLPAEITDAYVFPYLDRRDRQWSDWEEAMAWSISMFAELGLLTDDGP